MVHVDTYTQHAAILPERFTQEVTSLVIKTIYPLGIKHVTAANVAACSAVVTVLLFTMLV
jgi:hypothetical protein